MNTPVVDKLKSRAHWRVLIRPTPYVENRMRDLAALEATVRDACVSLRGWDFPHWDTHALPVRAVGRVEQGIEWEHHLDFWRAFSSGQIAILSGVWGDWRDQSQLWPNPAGGSSPRPSLSYEDLVYRLAEAFEFAARWAGALKDAQAFNVQIGLHNIAGRVLTTDDGRWLSPFAQEVGVNEWTYETSTGTADLLASGTDLAVAPTIQLLSLFRMDVGDDAVRAQQEKMYLWANRRRPSRQ